MKHKNPNANTLVFVSTGTSVTMLKVADKPTNDIIIFDDSKATVLTEDRKSTPAKQFEDFAKLKPYLVKAV